MAVAAETKAQAHAIATYDAWITANAPEFGDYRGIEVALNPEACSQRAWGTLARMQQDKSCMDATAEWSRRECEVCELSAVIRDRRHASIDHIAEAVEVFRSMWTWAPGEPFLMDGEECGCSEELAAIFSAIERLSSGGVHG